MFAYRVLSMLVMSLESAIETVATTLFKFHGFQILISQLNFDSAMQVVWLIIASCFLNLQFSEDNETLQWSLYQIRFTFNASNRNYFGGQLT